MNAPAAVRFGLLGCSSIARRRTLPALRSLPGARLTAVAARAHERATAFRDELVRDDVADGDCLATSYDQLLARDDVDAVYLSLPNGLHAPWAERVLRAGKHLLCEKPTTTSATCTRALARLAEDQRLVLRENMTFVHHPRHATVASLVGDGRIGELRAVHAVFCIPPRPADDIRYDPALGGGALLDAGVYPLRTAQLLLGPDLVVAGSSLRRGPTGVDLAGQALLVEKNGGALVTCEFGFQHAYGARYVLWGSTGTLTVERAFTPPPQWRPTVRIVDADGVEELDLPAADQFALTLEEFMDAVRSEPRPIDSASVAATLRTAELTDAVREHAVTVETDG